MTIANYIPLFGQRIGISTTSPTHLLIDGVQVDLGGVSAGLIGAANGIAPLDAGAKVPAAYLPSGVFATAAQGALADTAVQPGSLGSAAFVSTGTLASAAQGAKADTAVQPAAVAGRLLPSGGTAGLALIKQSGADYDVAWLPLPGGGDMLKATYDPDSDGVIAIAQGGTGASSQPGARSALGLATVAATGNFSDLLGAPSLSNLLAYRQTPSLARTNVANYNPSWYDGAAAAAFYYAEGGANPDCVATSTTSVAFGTGSKTFDISTGKDLFQAGKTITIRSAGSATAYMVGTITSYSGTSLVVNVTNAVGSGSATDWTLQVAYDRYVMQIQDRSGGTGCGHYAETGWAIGISRIKPDLSVEGQTGAINIIAKGGYTGSRDYSAAGYTAGDGAAIQGQYWTLSDTKAFGAWTECVSGIYLDDTNQVNARMYIGATRWDGLPDAFGGKINGIMTTANGLAGLGIAYYAHNGTGSWTYAFGTSAGAYITMNGTVHTVSDPDAKDGLEEGPAGSALLDVVKGTHVCSWLYKDDARRMPRLGVSSRDAGGLKGLSEALAAAGLDPQLAVSRHERGADDWHQSRDLGMGTPPDTVSLNGQVGILWGAVQALAGQVERPQQTRGAQ